MANEVKGEQGVARAGGQQRARWVYRARKRRRGERARNDKPRAKIKAKKKQENARVRGSGQAGQEEGL
jgi:hypothetical protein